MASRPPVVWLDFGPDTFDHGLKVNENDSRFSCFHHLVLTILASSCSIVSTATYTIAHDLNGGLGDATWIILAYTITYLSSTIIIARLSDVFGRRWSVATSFVVFIAASAGCGFAQTLNQLIAFRTVQGFGGAGLYTMAMIVLPEISPIKLLPAISSLIGMAVAIGSVLGPVLGGSITQGATWRWYG